MAPSRPWILDRTSLRIMLALVWLLDAALQFQPFMFTRGFAHDVLHPAGDGQPLIVSAPVHGVANFVASHAAVVNSLFAFTQLLIALGLLFRRTAKPTLAVSVVWSLAVWWLGEGLGGVLSGHAMLLTGAPGAVVLYAALAVAAWPREDAPISTGLVTGMWSVLWLFGGLLQILPGQNSGADIAAAVRDAADGAPTWLANFDASLAGNLSGGHAVAIGLALVQVLIGVGALVRGFTRTAALAGGLALTAGFWVIGQSFGEIATGHATDPNTGPLVVLLAIVMALSAPAAGRRHRMRRVEIAGVEQVVMLARPRSGGRARRRGRAPQIEITLAGADRHDLVTE